MIQLMQIGKYTFLLTNKKNNQQIFSLGLTEVAGRTWGNGDLSFGNIFGTVSFGALFMFTVAYG